MSQRINPGDIFEIDLGDGCYGYGRVLKQTCGFYDLRLNSRPPIESIIASPILFKVWVMDYAIKKKRWKIIGHASLTKDLLSSPYFFKKDSISGQLSVTLDGSQEIPATLDECEKLECAAVWDPEHVEDRLRDYFGGLPNSWYESMRP